MEGGAAQAFLSNLPSTGSIALTLSPFWTRTTVTWGAEGDEASPALVWGLRAAMGLVVAFGVLTSGARDCEEGEDLELLTGDGTRIEEGFQPVVQGDDEDEDDSVPESEDD